MAGESPAVVAERLGTPELAPYQTASFAAKKDARGFAIPVYPSKMVMVDEVSIPACKIAIREMDFPSFQKALSSAFSRDSLLKGLRGFEIIKNNDSNGNIDRVYAYNNYAVFVSAREEPQNGQIQALMILVRVKK